MKFLEEFSKKLSILIPYTSRNITEENGRREQLWQWVKKRYEIQFPYADICLGYYDEKPFSTSRALNIAYNQSDKNREYLFIVGADTIFDNHQYLSVMEMFDSDKYDIVIPFCRGVYFSKEYTDILLNQPPNISIRDTWDEAINPPFLSGALFPNNGSAYGVYFIRRSCWEEVGGYDNRFIGWGYEDRATGIILETLFDSRIAYLSYSTLWHLYHDHVYNYGPILDKTIELRDEYLKYYKNKEAMIEYLKSPKI